MVSKKNKPPITHSKTSKAKTSLLDLPKKMRFYNIKAIMWMNVGKHNNIQICQIILYNIKRI